MAAQIRALQPRDLLAYLGFAKRVDRYDGIVGLTGPVVHDPLRNLVTQSALLDPTRQRWICRDSGQIVASLGVRARPGVDIWEVEECYGLATPAGRLGRLRLLNKLAEEATEEGIQKVFMRVAEGSAIEELARQAGFVHYAVERMLRRPAGPLGPVGAPPGMRRRRGADHHALFRLYTAVVPGRVRQVEAMTLDEWRFVDGWHVGQMRWAPQMDLTRRDVVVDGDEGGLAAWLLVNRRRSLLRFLARPEYTPHLPQLVAWGVNTLHAPGGALCPLRDYQLDAEPALLDAGFRLEAQHALMAQVFALRVHEPKLVPVRA